MGAKYQSVILDTSIAAQRRTHLERLEALLGDPQRECRQLIGRKRLRSTFDVESGACPGFATGAGALGDYRVAARPQALEWNNKVNLHFLCGLESHAVQRVI